MQRFGWGLTISVWLGLAGAPGQLQAQTSSPESVLQAQFRGCDAAGWCRFWIDALDPRGDALHRVRPNGIAQIRGADAIAVRDRLNVLLVNMIHQDKRIELRDLRSLDDGTYAASVSVNDADVALDPVLLQLGKRAAE